MTELGVTFPQTEIGTDPAIVRDYAQAAEDLGYTHILTYDHVLGANPEAPGRPGQRFVYTHRSLFHEPLVLLGFLAGVTRRIQLVTGILILSQRQTALVAKQAAEVDVLSGGRLRLGVGLGWNAVEFAALGQHFHDRGKRIAEQIAVLRALWTLELVTFPGRWHQITDAGINPLPVQRPIPIWLGGSQREDVEPALRRIGALADGWVLVGPPAPGTGERMARVREYAREAGRDPATIGLQGGLLYRDGPDTWPKTLEEWRSIGATYVAVNTMGAQLASPSAHIDAIRQVKEALA
ncbi:MAG: TIGR03619 family F420-dependent LLM class oxidoreductase [Chloroflexi bacterium]|nr:TIGR03619 family F420-dependent LLM class oxidoreductase [Chloroflexota bacterium]